METIQIGIISGHRSSRLHYVLDFIFKKFFDADWRFIELDDPKDPCLLYANGAPGTDKIHIQDHGILDKDYNVKCENFMFPDKAEFDLFAFIFFSLTRAEEYQHQGVDPFGRFMSSDSFLKKAGLLQTPIVDVLLLQMAKQFKTKYGIQLKRKSSFKYKQTVDVDQFYAYKEKGFIRNLAGAARNILHIQIGAFIQRIKSGLGMPDPYDTFELLKNKLHPSFENYFFFLVGNYNHIDNALDIKQEPIASKITKIAHSHRVGLHPSVQSGKNEKLLNEEKRLLEEIVGKQIRRSRQHYLHLHFPNTYRHLRKHKITEDHSLSYHDEVGFRAGTTESFYWYDLMKEEQTDLLLVPFQVMDVTLKKYMHLDPLQAKNQVKELIDQCIKVDGPFSILWHNSSFYAEEGWKGWEEVLFFAQKYCLQALESKNNN